MSSGSAAIRRTWTPSGSRRFAIHVPFVFGTAPEVSSFPIVRMAAVATGAEYKEAMPSVRELEERRDFECRLTPDRALETLDDAEAFLRERGLLTRTADCSLPSLFGATHEEAYRPGASGFGSWPRTRYIWS